MTEPSPALVKAREEFLALVDSFRPELHRYCARLTGSVIEGEDIVQETLAKGFYTLSLSTEVPPLRPWLFRIAHNAAIDFLKSHGHKYTEARADFDDVQNVDDAPDPSIVRAALVRFLSLPVAQRSAVILKDVLGHSLAETAETMGTTIPAVKAALLRGREKLRQTDDSAAANAEAEARTRADLNRYASLFNERDWDGVRALVGNDCRLDLVSKSQRRGKEVGLYFTNLAKSNLSVRVVRLEGNLALAAYVDGATTPSYFMLLAFENGHVQSIRDFRYVPYIANEAVFELCE